MLNLIRITSKLGGVSNLLKVTGAIIADQLQHVGTSSTLLYSQYDWVAYRHPIHSSAMPIAPERSWRGLEHFVSILMPSFSCWCQMRPLPLLTTTATS